MTIQLISFFFRIVFLFSSPSDLKSQTTAMMTSLVRMAHTMNLCWTINPAICYSINRSHTITATHYIRCLKICMSQIHYPIRYQIVTHRTQRPPAHRHHHHHTHRRRHRRLIRDRRVRWMPISRHWIVSWMHWMHRCHWSIRKLRKAPNNWSAPFHVNAHAPKTIMIDWCAKRCPHFHITCPVHVCYPASTIVHC